MIQNLLKIYLGVCLLSVSNLLHAQCTVEKPLFGTYTVDPVQGVTIIDQQNIYDKTADNQYTWNRDVILNLVPASNKVGYAFLSSYKTYYLPSSPFYRATSEYVTLVDTKTKLVVAHGENGFFYAPKDTIQVRVILTRINCLANSRGTSFYGQKIEILPFTPCYKDVDGDGYAGSADTYDGCIYATNPIYVSDDCNDNDAKINPKSAWYQDEDEDGYGVGNPIIGCKMATTRFSLVNGDCDDKNKLANVVKNWYLDNDNDKYGSSNSKPIINCINPSTSTDLYVDNNKDCNDNNPLINPDAVEIYGNSVDENCDNILVKGNALSFKRDKSNYILVPHTNSINLTNNYTIESWIKLPLISVNYTIVDKGDYDFLLQINSNDQLAFYNSALGTWNTSSLKVTKGEWNHVALVITGSNEGLFYINGVKDATTFTFKPASDNLAMNIGRQQPSSCQCNYFDGIMDEFRIWNVARTSDQINAAKDSSLTGKESSLALLYNFDSGIPNADNTSIFEVTDLSPNKNVGSLVNFNRIGLESNFVDGKLLKYNLIPATSGCSNPFAYNYNPILKTNTEKDCLYFTKITDPKSLTVKNPIDTAVRIYSDCNFDFGTLIDSVKIDKVSRIQNSKDSVIVTWKVFQNTKITTSSLKYRVKASGSVVFVFTLLCTNATKRANFTNLEGFTFVAGADVESPIITNVDNVVVDNSISIFPNPSKGVFDLKSLSQLGNLSVFNSIGTLIYSQSTDQNSLSIDLNNHQSGIYFVKIADKIYKLIKE